MQITRDLAPEQRSTVDRVVQASDLVYSLTAKQLVNNVLTARSLAANTGFIAIVYEADPTTLKNAQFSFTQTTTPGSIVATTPPGSDGHLTITIPGNWTAALAPGSYVVTLLMTTATDTILLGRLWWTILSPAAG